MLRTTLFILNSKRTKCRVNYIYRQLRSFSNNCNFLVVNNGTNCIQALSTLEKSDIPAQALVRTLCKKPGLKDNNFQVIKLKLEAVKYLAEKSDFSKRTAEYCIPDVVDKLSDAKNGAVTTETLTAISEATTLDFVALIVMDFAMGQKNPKVQAEALLWLSNAIREFGFV